MTTPRKFSPKQCEKQSARLVAFALAWLETKFGPANMDYRPEWTVATVAGDYRFGLRATHEGGIALEGRFANAKVATEIYDSSFSGGDINPFSGKWNNYFWASNAVLTEDTVQMWLSLWRDDLARAFQAEATA